MSILARLPQSDTIDSDPLYNRKYIRDMQSYRESIQEEAAFTLQLSKEYPKIQQYIECLEGDGWWDRRRPQYLSKFFDNRLEHTRYSSLALLTDIRPTIDVRSKVKEFQEQASVAQGIIHYEWMNQDLDLVVVSVVDAAMLFGNAFLKIGASMPGNMSFTPCGPDMVMPVQPGNDIQSSTAILYKTYKPIQYFINIWPERSANLEEEGVSVEQYAGTTYARPPRVDEYTWGQMSPQMRAKVGIKVGSQRPANTPYPVIELNEIWVDDPSINESKEIVLMRDNNLSLDQQNYSYQVKPGQRLYPRKRLIVFAGTRLMYDGPSPYWHGLYPFAMLRLNPTVWSFWGLSKYRNLIPINKALNDIGAGTLDSVKRALNPQVITKEGGVPKGAWENYFPNMPGGKLRMGPASNPSTDIRYMDPPPLPGYVFQYVTYLTTEYERLSGSMDVSKLGGKKQVPGGETIEQMRDMQNTGVRLEGRYIETFLRDAGQIAVPNIFQFYTASKRFRVLGGDGLTWEDFDYDPGNMVPAGVPPEDHIKNFSIEIAPGSLLGANKDREKSQAAALFKINAISRKMLLRRMEVPEEIIKKNEQEIEEESKTKTLSGDKGGMPRMKRSQRQGEAI